MLQTCKFSYTSLMSLQQGAWWYNDNKDKLQQKRKFSKDDMEKWNEKKKKEIKDKVEK